MNNQSDRSFLVFPTLVGLVAGLGYGIFAHYANLPLSLTEQLLPPLQLTIPTATLGNNL
jgi:hypothetical protein